MKAIILCLVSLYFMACTSSSTPTHKAKDLAIENLKLTATSPQQFKIVEVSKVDSAFGVNDFTEQELRLMFKATKTVSDKLLHETNGFENFEAPTPALQELFDRQMKVTSEMRHLMMQTSKGTKTFSGYKLRIKYQCLLHGYPYKALRWYFIDPKGVQVLKTLEIPLL